MEAVFAALAAVLAPVYRRGDLQANGMLYLRGLEEALPWMSAASGTNVGIRQQRIVRQVQQIGAHLGYSAIRSSRAGNSRSWTRSVMAWAVVIRQSLPGAARAYSSAEDATASCPDGVHPAPEVPAAKAPHAGALHDVCFDRDAGRARST